MPTLQAAVLLVVILVSNVTTVRPYTVAYKCCGVYQHLDSSGKCVHADWPQAHVHVDMNETNLVLALDQSWTSRWFPPGLPRNVLLRGAGLVFHSVLTSPKERTPQAVVLLNGVLTEYSIRVPVNRSLFYRDAKFVRDWSKSMVVLGKDLVRPFPGKGLRSAFYCVDAMEGSTAPYAVVFRTTSVTFDDDFCKCCKFGELVVQKRAGHLDCEMDPRAWTRPANASFSSYFDKEIPLRFAVKINKLHKFKWVDMHFQAAPLPPGDVRFIKYLSQFSVEFLSSTWLYPCADVARNEDGDVTEVLGYFVVNRRTRAAYLVSRNLSFVSALILVAALVAIGCKERMRSSAHGWALGCHVLCLLLFNVGQTIYYLSMSAKIDGREQMNPDRSISCLGFAIPMYFLLTGANAWMTAVSANMFFGFKIRGGPRAGGGDKKRFLKLSVFAWGVSAALTGICVAVFLNVQEAAQHFEGNDLSWYRPTFAETRTCYNEVGYLSIDNLLTNRSQKLGTTLYYYVPTLALVAANGAFLWLTGRKVRYLRRGNSLLKRDEREGGGRRGGGGQQDKGSTAQPKGVTVYIKLLLAGGLFEFLAEALTWAVSSYQPGTTQVSEDYNAFARTTEAELFTFQYKDHMYAHKTAGYWADIFRALVVLLVLVAAPDLRAAWRRIHGKGGDSPIQGAAPRPPPRDAAGPALPRRGQQESAL